MRRTCGCGAGCQLRCRLHVGSGSAATVPYDEPGPSMAHVPSTTAEPSWPLAADEVHATGPPCGL